MTELLLRLSEQTSRFSVYKPEMVTVLAPPLLIWVSSPHVGWTLAVMSGSDLGVSYSSRILQGGFPARDVCGAAGFEVYFWRVTQSPTHSFQPNVPHEAAGWGNRSLHVL